MDRLRILTFHNVSDVFNLLLQKNYYVPYHILYKGRVREHFLCYCLFVDSPLRTIQFRMNWIPSTTTYPSVPSFKMTISAVSLSRSKVPTDVNRPSTAGLFR